MLEPAGVRRIVVARPGFLPLLRLGSSASLPKKFHRASLTYLGVRSLSRSNVIPILPRVFLSLMSSVRFDAVKEIGIETPESPTGMEYLAWNTAMLPG